MKPSKELEIMRIAGRITAEARLAAAGAVKPGVTNRRKSIKSLVQRLKRQGQLRLFLVTAVFPEAPAFSINDEVIHGIPSRSRVIHEGDLVKVDVGACYQGYHGDCAATIPCGEVSAEARKLIDVTRQSFYEGIKFARKGNRISDISHAIQEYVESNGFHVSSAAM